MSDITNKLHVSIQGPNAGHSTTPWQLTVKGIGGKLPQNDGFIPNFEAVLREYLPSEHESAYSSKQGKRNAHIAKEPGVAELDIHHKGYKLTVTVPNDGPIDGHTFIQAYVNRLDGSYELTR
jgi:hypothetical protein